MKSTEKRPSWWKLYIIFPLLLALFTVDSRLKISARGHQAVQIAIVLIVFGLTQLWIKANSSALVKMDQRQYHGTYTVLEYPPYQQIVSNKKLQIPDTEVKGLLNDTFEMDNADAEYFTAEEYRRN